MRMRLVAWWLSGVISSLTLSGDLLAKTDDMTVRQSQAEREQTALRERIRVLQQEIDVRESARKEAADALKTSETAISVSNRRLAEFTAQLNVAQAELDALHLQIRQQQGVLATR